MKKLLTYPRNSSTVPRTLYGFPSMPSAQMSMIPSSILSSIRAIVSDLEAKIGEARPIRYIPEVCDCITPTESPGSLDCAVCGGNIRKRFAG